MTFFPLSPHFFPPYYLFLFFTFTSCLSSVFDALFSQTCLSSPFIFNAASHLSVSLFSSFSHSRFATNVFYLLFCLALVCLCFCLHPQNWGATKGNFSSRRLCWEKLLKMLGDTAGRWKIMVIIIKHIYIHIYGYKVINRAGKITFRENIFLNDFSENDPSVSRLG